MIGTGIVPTPEISAVLKKKLEVSKSSALMSIIPVFMLMT